MVELFHGNKYGISVGVWKNANMSLKDKNDTTIIRIKSPNDNIYDEVMATKKIVEIIVI